MSPQILKATRYTLAAICLAASVGCLALWWRSAYQYQAVSLPTLSSGIRLQAYVIDGTARLFAIRVNAEFGWRYMAFPVKPLIVRNLRESIGGRLFRIGGANGRMEFSFPLWYSALVFALAAVAAIRIGRQFTLRSALVGMSVVAVLLGMVVAL